MSTNRLPYFEVNAFTGKNLLGNSAGVCPLEKWLRAEEMLKIAAQNNLSETAFYVPIAKDIFELRWFTINSEVDLCGHATLATAHILFSEYKSIQQKITFRTKSGELEVVKDQDFYILNFPVRPGKEIQPNELHRTIANNYEIVSLYSSRDLMMVFKNESEVRNFQPNFDEIVKLSEFGLIITAPGSDCDFVARFFLPKDDLPEDPVTGSTHCTLIPYWANRLNKNKLHAKQVSARGGEIFCELKPTRVYLSGRAKTYLKGEIEIE